MAQIQAGTSYSTGMAVTAANLNAHVNNATLQEGCISAQSSSPLVSSTDNILISNGSALNKTTLASIVAPLNLFDKSQAQTLGQNVSLASGADIALASGSIMALSSGAQITLASGSSMTLSSGAILTLGQDPVSAFQAVPKQYVDNGFLNKSTGGLVSGSISMIGTSSILTLSADPVSALQAVPKQYVDNSTANAVAKIRLQTTQDPNVNNTLITSFQINATYSQGTTTTGTISVPDATFWASSSQPFFLEGQYIGILSSSLSPSTPAFPSRLYRIQSVNYAAKTFTITSPDSTARSGTIILSCVYRNATPPPSDNKIDANGNKNIKSVYVCNVSNKYYINYWYDTKGTALNVAPTELNSGVDDDQKTLVMGMGYVTGPNMLNMLMMAKTPASLAATTPYAQDQPMGFGATSKGVHVGAFYSYNNGNGYNYIWDSNIFIFK